MATPALTSVSSSDGHGRTVEPLSENNISKIPHILPHERVFPIQIGSELFKLSGASISSDGSSTPCEGNASGLLLTVRS